MLRKLRVQGFKSLRNIELRLPRLTVLFGTNAAGKSNLLDAIQILSGTATSRTLAEAFAPIRGRSLECFSFPAGGYPALLAKDEATFSFDTELMVEAQEALYRYRLSVAVHPKSGALSVRDEYLAELNSRGDPRLARIELQGDKFSIRRRSHPGRPHHVDLGRSYSALSDPRFSGSEYPAWERIRGELFGWQIYYFDPRMAMRDAQPPSDVRDIGPLGSMLAPFLYRLRSERPDRFETLKRTVRSVIPDIEDVSVDLDTSRGNLDIQVTQGGVSFSSRIISEGTLRVLALAALAVNPWKASLIAFEEPENGVDPQRLALVAQLLVSLSLEQNIQLVVTTHSLLFCDAILPFALQRPDDISMVRVTSQADASTAVRPIDIAGPLFRPSEIRKIKDALRQSDVESSIFESLASRGLV